MPEPLTDDQLAAIRARHSDAESLNADMLALLAEVDRLRKQNRLFQALAEQFEAAVDRVAATCDAIENECDGDDEDDAEGALEAIARVRAAATDPQP